MFDKDVAPNWHLRMRLKIEELQQENDKLKAKNNILERKIKKYEDNNIRTTGNRQDDNFVRSSG